MRKYLSLFFISALFLLTVASLPSVDYVETSVFFYLEHLPVIYYVCIVASVIIAFRDKQELTRLVSVCVLTLLIILTPSIMYTQPWHLDSYPFVAEAVYVARNAHLSTFHYLSESPVLGLTFGAFLLITGIDPLVLLKIYPAILALLLVIFVYVIATKLKIDKKVSIIAPLLFISMMWPDIFHFSRFGFSLLYYFMFLFLLFYSIFKNTDRRILVLLFFPIIPLVMSHPATPLFLMINLVAMAVFGLASKRLQPREILIIFNTFVAVSVSWLLWNMIGTTPGVFHSLNDIIVNVVNELVQSPSSAVSGFTEVFVGHTQIYGWLLNSRLVLMAFVYISAFLIPLITYTRLKKHKILFILTAWAWSSMSITIPLIFIGLPYFQKPAFLAIAALGPVALLVFKSNSSPWVKKIQYLFVIVILASALLMPLFKYAPLPLEYPSSKELASKSFLDFYGSTSIRFIYFEDPAYYYSYILYDQPELQVDHYGFLGVYIRGEGLNSSIVAESSLWVTSRSLVRDAFWAYYPSIHNIVENVTVTLPETTHNKVYDSGYPECILVPTDIG